MQQQVQIFVNGQTLDLSSDLNPVALIFQINNLADVQNQSGNTSNQFTIPLTQRNRNILGLPDDIIIKSDKPYRQYPCKLVQSGVEVIPAGVLIIDHTDGKTADIVITSGNFDFFNQISYQLYDMGDSTSQATGYGLILPFKPYDHLWNVANAASSQEKTDGWIWPIVDYGSVPATAPYNDPGQYINVRNQRPAFFVHTVIELLAQAAGYDIDYSRGSLMRDPLYRKLLIPFSNNSFSHGIDYQNANNQQLGVTTSKSLQQILYPGGPAAGNITFQPATNFTDGINYYCTQAALNGTVTVTFDAFMQGLKTTKNPSQVKININVRQADGTNANLATFLIAFDDNSTRVTGDGGSRIDSETFLGNKLSIDVELQKGDAININYQIQNSAQTYFIMKAGATFQFLVDEVSVLYGQSIQCEQILPDVAQKDFLKCILQKFGIICQSNNITKQITFASFSDIVSNIPRAKDWTSKCVDAGKQVYMNLGQNYDQINWMRYQYDSLIPLTLMPKYFADDKIVIDDKTINPATPQQDLFDSIFSPTLNRPFIGGTIAQINDPTSTEDFSVGGQPRILVDEKYILKAGESVTFADNAYPYQTTTQVLNEGMVISIPYFYKPNGDYNLCFCDKNGQPGLRSVYYPELEGILKRTKKVIRYFMLTPYDIANLDLLIPVYNRYDGCYFYINKIDSWVKGQPTKVELVRLYN